VRIEQTFAVAAPSEAVFDFMTDPENLAKWQTSKTRVEPLTEGSPGQGYRVREWTKPPHGKEFEQVVEFAEFDRPNRLHVHIVDGPYPVDGTWVLHATEHGTKVDFVAEGSLRGLLRLIGPIAGRLMRREFAEYHENLRRGVEARV
jgi:carbon monoxide dehydrogenase subunit G